MKYKITKLVTLEGNRKKPLLETFKMIESIGGATVLEIGQLGTYLLLSDPEAMEEMLKRLPTPRLRLKPFSQNKK